VTQRPDGRFFIIQKKRRTFSMAKTQTQAAEQAAPEKTAEQTPVNYDVRIFGARAAGPSAQPPASTSTVPSRARRQGAGEQQGTFRGDASVQGGKRDYKDICFPCTKESREQFNAAVMKAYEQTLTQNTTAGGSVRAPADPGHVRPVHVITHNKF
jgi:stage V sporulation protein G